MFIILRGDFRPLTFGSIHYFRFLFYYPSSYNCVHGCLTCFFGGGGGGGGGGVVIHA